jgi:transcriptional regulator with XRE-family HTH domain
MLYDMKSESKKKEHPEVVLAELTPLIGVGRNLRRLRMGWRLSQRQLAELAGTTQSTIAHIESGKANPTIELLDKITKPMGMEPRINLVRRPQARRK